MPAVKSGGGTAIKTVGGVTVRNRRGQTILWVKAKDPDNGNPPFCLCAYHPDLADDGRMRRNLEMAFRQIKEFAAAIGMPLFDANELKSQLELAFGKHPPTVVEREFPIFLTDMISGRRARLTLAAHSPEAS